MLVTVPWTLTSAASLRQMDGPARWPGVLLKDDSDTYFRLYMFLDGELRNVAPEPGEGGYDRLW
jgi:hypothetical protein